MYPYFWSCESSFKPETINERDYTQHADLMKARFHPEFMHIGKPSNNVLNETKLKKYLKSGVEHFNNNLINLFIKPQLTAINLA